VRDLRRRSSGAVVAAVAVLATAFGVVVTTRSALFDVRAFEVRGTGHLSRDEIVRLADVSAGTSTVWLDASAIERRLEADPWIREATVGASWPHTVDIAIRERRPIAIAVDDGTRTLVAADGTMLGPADRTRALPEISLADVAPDDVAALAMGAARAVDALSPSVARSVDRVVARPDGSLELRLVGDVVVRYGSPTRAGEKALALADVLRWARHEGSPLARITLSAPELPAVTFAS
jgi:cell division protein FtsQ